MSDYTSSMLLSSKGRALKVVRFIFPKQQPVKKKVEKNVVHIDAARDLANSFYGLKKPPLSAKDRAEILKALTKP